MGLGDELCPVCGPSDAPRPTGTQTFTFDGVIHKAAECAALSSVGESVVPTDDGYRSRSGVLVCMECFPYGRQHIYNAGDDPHERG